MTKKSLLFGTLVALAIIVLSACGNSSDQSSSTPAPTSSASTPVATSSASTGQAVEIKLMAKDFEYDQKEIHVKKGDKVKITLQSDDGGHGFTIPDYNVTINGNGSAEFIADKAGQYEFHCSVMCGSGHMQMKGTLIVT
jgi:cytochrome c oxidase subunit 2